MLALVAVLWALPCCFPRGWVAKALVQHHARQARAAFAAPARCCPRAARAPPPFSSPSPFSVRAASVGLWVLADGHGTSTSPSIDSDSDGDGADPDSPALDLGEGGPTENQAAKLRALQIAMEFERVQSSLPDPAAIRNELESRFDISTRYFQGVNEMAYALAVSRVDAAGENDDDPCLVGEDGRPILIPHGGVSKCLTHEDLRNPEDLIAVEYENINLHYEDLASLASELEEQYGVPSKHFQGKKEMAYALAVERVDRAMQEGGLIYDEAEEEEENGSGVLTDEDMMRMMEEEMSREDTEEEEENSWKGDRMPNQASETRQVHARELWPPREQEQQQQQPNQQPQQQQQPPQQQQPQHWASSSRRESSSFATTFSGSHTSVRDSPTSVAATKFKKQGPNPFQKKAKLEYQSTPLADMIKDEKNSRGAQPKKRTPLSSEQHSFQKRRGRTLTAMERGAVIGESVANVHSNDRAGMSLADILKESKQPRSQATAPSSRASVQDRPLRTSVQASSKAPSSSPSPPDYRFDTIFRQQPAQTFATKRAASSPRNNNTNKSSRGYVSSWDRQKGGKASVGPSTVSTQSGFGGKGGYSSSQTATQRPFEPAPFTAPESRNSSQKKSTYSSKEPQRVPPKTPFQSPVNNNFAQHQRPRNSQGPFTPFTPPGKRSTNGTPPPSRKPFDPRAFNIKDTPSAAQPFVGSQVFVDAKTPYAPPLQVEPPPRDPRYGKKPERPFEPAPFSTPNGAAAEHMRNRRAAGGNNSYRNAATNERRYHQHSTSASNHRGRGSSSSSSSSSPFDNLKDMFRNVGGKKGAAVEEPEPPGFKSGNVEVLTTPNNEGGRWPSKSNEQPRTNAVEVEIIDAEAPSGATISDWQRGVESWPTPPSPSNRRASNASAENSAASTTNAHTFCDNTDNYKSVLPSNHHDVALLQKAKLLLSQSPELRALVTMAQSEPRVREAVRECQGDPRGFGRYLVDPVAGPVLRELKEECASLVL